jgi:hypothetical protein
MARHFPPQALLDPLILEWFRRDEARTPGIFRDEYNFRDAAFAALELFVPTQTIQQFTTPTDHKIVVIGVVLVNSVVQAGENPLVLKTFTRSHCSGTMSWKDIFRIEIRKDNLCDTSSVIKKIIKLLATRKLEAIVGLLEIAYNGKLKVPFVG